MKRFLYSIVLTVFSFNAFSNPTTFYRGADAIVERSALPLEIYLPSHRFLILQALRNYRFLGNRGAWNPAIPVHFQNMTTDRNPQTYVDSFMQLMFPSPDGINFTPNQAGSDPISRLTIDDLVKLIGLSKSLEVSAKDVQDALFPDVRFTPVIQNNYPAFLRYEFLSHIQGDLDGISPEEIEEVKNGARYAKLNAFKEKSHKALSKKQQGEWQKLKETLGEKADLYVFFERNRDAFLKYRFVDTFLKARQEKGTLIENPVEKAIVGYMWTKFKTPEEYAEFYEKMGVPELLPVFKSPGYSQDDYVWLDTECNLSSEKLALLKFGQAVFDGQHHQPIPYSQATVTIEGKEKGFSNCAESAILSLLLNKAYHLTGEGFQANPAAFRNDDDRYPKSKELNAFFKKFNMPLKLQSQDARNQFAQILVGLPSVEYNNGTYEIRPGIINGFHVLGNLVPELESLLKITSESTDKEISDGFTQLTSVLFGEGWDYSPSDEVKYIEDGEYNFSAHVKRNDIFPNVNFSHGEELVYTWAFKHNEGHTALVSRQKSSATLSGDEDLLALVKRDPLKARFLGTEDDEGSGNFMVSSFSSIPSRARTIREIFTNSDLAYLKPFGYSLLAAQAAAEEAISDDEDMLELHTLTTSNQKDMTNKILYDFAKRMEIGEISRGEYEKMLHYGLNKLPGDNILSDFSCETLDIKDLFDLGFGDILREKAKVSDCLCMNVPTSAERDLFNQLFDIGKKITTLQLRVPTLSDLQTVFETLKSRNTEDMCFTINITNLEIPSGDYSLDWLSFSKNEFQFNFFNVTSPDYESFEEFFTKLFEVAPNVHVSVSGPSLGIKEQILIAKHMKGLDPKHQSSLSIFNFRDLQSVFKDIPKDSHILVQNLEIAPDDSFDWLSSPNHFSLHIFNVTSPDYASFERFFTKLFGAAPNVCVSVSGHSLGIKESNFIYSHMKKKYPDYTKSSVFLDILNFRDLQSDFGEIPQNSYISVQNLEIAPDDSFDWLSSPNHFSLHIFNVTSPDYESFEEFFTKLFGAAPNVHVSVFDHSLGIKEGEFIERHMRKRFPELYPESQKLPLETADVESEEALTGIRNSVTGNTAGLEDDAGPATLRRLPLASAGAGTEEKEED